MHREENKVLLTKITQLQLELEKASMPISEDLHSDFRKIFSENLDKQNVPPFMKLIWQEQQKYLNSSKTGIRYHPMVIRYCLNFAAKSPSVYEEIRYDESRSYQADEGCAITNILHLREDLTNMLLMSLNESILIS